MYISVIVQDNVCKDVPEDLICTVVFPSTKIKELSKVNN